MRASIFIMWSMQELNYLGIARAVLLQALPLSNSLIEGHFQGGLVVTYSLVPHLSPGTAIRSMYFNYSRASTPDSTWQLMIKPLTTWVAQGYSRKIVLQQQEIWIIMVIIISGPFR